MNVKLKEILDAIENAHSQVNPPVPSDRLDALGIRSFCFNSPIGWIHVVGEGSYISQIYFHHIPPLSIPEIPEDPLLNYVYDILTSYFTGETVDFNQAPLKLNRGTEFQIAVWNTIREIPSGETRPYKWLAEQIGSPKAARAVGGAVGANPISIIIPCHRVIRSNGTLGGYGGGVRQKRLLLELEGYPVETLK